MRQEGIDRDGITVHDVDDAVGHARLLGQLSQKQRRRGVLLRWLQDEGVAARDGVGQHPERDHHREVERGDAGDHAQRFEHGMDVDTARHLGRVRPLQQVRDAAREFDVFESSSHLAGRVAEHLPVLRRDGSRQVGGGFGHQVTKAEEDAGPRDSESPGPSQRRPRTRPRRRGRPRSSRPMGRRRAARRAPGRRPGRGAPMSRPPTCPRPSARARGWHRSCHAAGSAALCDRGRLAGQLGQLLGDHAVVFIEIAPGRPRAPAAPHEEDEHREHPHTDEAHRPPSLPLTG